MKKIMIITGIVLFVLLLGLAGLLGWAKYKINHVVDEKNLEATLDKQVTAYLQKGNVGAVVIGVVKDGRTLVKGYGSIDTASVVPPDAASAFELASTSKLFTTSLLQLMVDAGTLRLDDEIQTLLPPDVVLPPIAAHTTLRHLATHSSGFPSLPESFLAKMTDESNPYKDLQTADLYAYLKTCAGKKPEGAFEYSNLGMGLLGHLLERKAGIPYEQLVQERLLKPLGMHHTFVTIDSTNRNKVVQGYDETGQPAPVWTDHVLTGAGSFLSDGADMVRFIQANLSVQHSVVSESLLRTQLQQPGSEMGLGWILPSAMERFQGTKEIVWHNGMAGGYASFLVVNPTLQYGIIILTNKSIDPTAFGMRLTRLVQSQSWK